MRAALLALVGCGGPLDIEPVQVAVRLSEFDDCDGRGSEDAPIGEVYGDPVEATNTSDEAWMVIEDDPNGTVEELEGVVTHAKLRTDLGLLDVIVADQVVEFRPIVEIYCLDGRAPEPGEYRRHAPIDLANFDHTREEFLTVDVFVE